MNQIDPLLPTPVPTSTDPANFDVRADALIAALPGFVDDVNLVAVEINQTAQMIVGSYATHTGSLTLAASGTLNFTFAPTQPNKTFIVGQQVIVYQTIAPTNNWMSGQVTTFTPSTGAIVITLSAKGSGTGSLTGWTIASSAPIINPSWVGSIITINAAYGCF
jgi:hypothetical protein